MPPTSDMWPQLPSLSRREQTVMIHNLSSALLHRGPNYSLTEERACPDTDARLVVAPANSMAAGQALPSALLGSYRRAVAALKAAPQFAASLHSVRSLCLRALRSAEAPAWPWQQLLRTARGTPLEVRRLATLRLLRSTQARNARKCAEPHFVHAGGWDEESGWEEWDSSRGGVDPRQSPPQSSAFSCRGRRKRCGHNAPHRAARAAATVLTLLSRQEQRPRVGGPGLEACALCYCLLSRRHRACGAA